MKSHTDTAEPKRPTPSTEEAEPSRAKERSDREDPRCMKSRTLMELPAREKDRKLRELPRCKKSRQEQAPMRLCACTLIVAPSRAKSRRLWLNFDAPITLIPPLTRKYERAESELERCKQS